MRAAFAIALAACSTAPAPALTGTTTAASPSGPAPSIEWQAPLGFRVERMPALARAGGRVLLPIADNDAGRGYPNLRIELRDRRDRVERRIDVIAADSFERLVPDGTTPGPELERRIAAGNQELAQLHREHGFAPLRVYQAQQPGGGPGAPIEGDGLAVSLDADHRLRVRRADTMLATVDGTAWLAPAGKRCAQCEPCENPASLAAFYSAAETDTIVVRITYAGTDTCWEPPDQWHVVSW